jgi:hypothetical protein
MVWFRRQGRTVRGTGAGGPKRSLALVWFAREVTGSQ